MPPKSKAPKQLQKALHDELKDKDNKVNLGDTASLKRALDDAVVEELKYTDYHLDHTYFDLRIVFGLASCAVALLAQFYPLKYPASFWLLVCCVTTYTVLSTAMTLVTMFLEHDAIAFTKPNSKKGGVALIVGSKMPRYQEMYTLRIQTRGAPKGRDEVQFSKSVANYFDSEGHLAVETIKDDFTQLLEQFEAQYGRGKKQE